MSWLMPIGQTRTPPTATGGGAEEGHAPREIQPTSSSLCCVFELLAFVVDLGENVVLFGGFNLAVGFRTRGSGRYRRRRRGRSGCHIEETWTLGHRWLRWLSRLDRFAGVRTGQVWKVLPTRGLRICTGL